MTQIAVVGAGIAGLNAALTSQDAGLSCTIYEASHHELFPSERLSGWSPS
jgi:2-polyprenyl-6-methoxyphenol hydroxylase-like FAD-dependent oxidoreductase